MFSQNAAVQKSPKNLKDKFRPTLEKWGFNSVRSQLLGKIQENWLLGEKGIELDLFRQENHKNMADLEWLQSQGFISSTGLRYYPKFLGFCALLVLGNAKAIKLRETMDGVVRVLKSYMKVRPLKLQRPLAELESAMMFDEHKKMLMYALQLMQDKGTGVSFNTHSPTHESDINFSDRSTSGKAPR